MSNPKRRRTKVGYLRKKVFLENIGRNKKNWKRIKKAHKQARRRRRPKKWSKPKRIKVRKSEKIVKNCLSLIMTKYLFLIFYTLTNNLEKYWETPCEKDHKGPRAIKQKVKFFLNQKKGDHSNEFDKHIKYAYCFFR